MKCRIQWLTGLLIILVVAGWTWEARARDLPSSRRSRQAINRKRPLLEKHMAGKGFSWGMPIYLRIFKAEKQLELWMKRGNRFHLLKTYPICTYGQKGLGPKLREGDGRAPEGFYFVAPRQMNPQSNFHLAFNLGYPNTYDRVHGHSGSALMVHGSCVSIGCYAMTDKIIEEIYVLADAALGHGQPFFRVHIFPFRMTDENLRRYRGSRWYGFWCNLKKGYDWFAAHQYRPPDVTTRNGRYEFGSASQLK
jgi:murein L,D-transpeptidase YafK